MKLKLRELKNLIKETIFDISVEDYKSKYKPGDKVYVTTNSSSVEKVKFFFLEIEEKTIKEVTDDGYITTDGKIWNGSDFSWYQKYKPDELDANVLHDEQSIKEICGKWKSMENFSQFVQDIKSGANVGLGTKVKGTKYFFIRNAPSKFKSFVTNL